VVAIYTASLFSEEVRGGGGRESVLVSKMERVWVGESGWPWFFGPAGIWRNYRPTFLS